MCRVVDIKKGLFMWLLSGRLWLLPSLLRWTEEGVYPYVVR